LAIGNREERQSSMVDRLDGRSPIDDRRSTIDDRRSTIDDRRC